MPAASDNVLLVLDLVGVFVFAISGGLVGLRARLDLFGIAVLAWVTGLGGGIIRDVFLADVPPAGVTNPWYILSVVLAGVVVVLVQPALRDLRRRNPDLRLSRIANAVKYLDAVGLAVFAVSGATKAISFGAAPLACILIGGITAVGGGAIRDVLARQVPEVLRRELYAVPALLGATLVVVADQFEMLSVLIVWLAVAVVFAIRVAAIIFDLHVPKAPHQGASS
ncbi:MAG: trimeric intracellular cation channel family protein [Ornithinimicrobium sp.]|uniref:trimeric intracellular cation channel family protein n=1 Tax=Ornithinimicrobium sp. TaxID=1977084 RepID=UPI0026E079D4|nr:trimeric intracellular cation channel family protein [Ornithinimicrobium sp.]MDO5738746.1 trimeric intracellular cation channel family protein [Ornithinimicrobium sp.]